jgi:hypothetical protein
MYREVPASELQCPQCDGKLRRVRRRLHERLLSFFLPVRRYQCLSWDCGWEGVITMRQAMRLQAKGSEARRAATLPSSR